MNKVISFLFFSLFFISAKGQSAFCIKEGLMYTNTLFYTDSVFGVEAMIDTGCSLCVIDSTYASSLGLKITTEGKVAVDGRKEGLPTCVIDSIKFCEKLYKKVPCLVANLKGTFQEYAPNFIVGGDVLRDRPLKFNQSTMMIEPFRGKREKGNVVMKWKDHKSEPGIPALYIMLEAKINGLVFNFAFDTGSRGNKLPSHIMLDPSYTIQRETADINNKLTIRPQKVYKNINIKISNHTFNLDFFEGRKKWGLLGLDFLEGHSFILNYKERTLEIIP